MTTDEPRTDADAARIALACLDLTSLNDGDTEADVVALCERASGRARRGGRGVRVAALRAPGARHALSRRVKVAAVANFPDGATDVGAHRARRRHHRAGRRRRRSTSCCPGARCSLATRPPASPCCARRAAPARGLTLKVILETGELRDDAVIERAARLALAEGADFLKTSTGKTPVSATPQAARCDAARDRSRCRRRARASASRPRAAFARSPTRRPTSTRWRRRSARPR